MDNMGLSQEIISLAAKSSRYSKEEWLPFWVHSIDVAEVLKKMMRRWIPLSIYSSFQGMSEDEVERLLYFIGMIHDIGKMTALFQSRIMPSIESQNMYLEKNGFILRNANDFKYAGETSHPIAGEAILLKYGCPAGVAAVVGSHHGKPEALSQNPSLLIDVYGKNFYDHQKEKWFLLWKEWISYSLNRAGYRSMQDIPIIDQSTQVLLTGILIVGDWLASNTQFFHLYRRDDMPLHSIYPARVNKAWRTINFPERWCPENPSIDDEEFLQIFGFIPNEIQKAMLDVTDQMSSPGLMILEAQMGIGKTEAALAASEVIAYRYGEGGVFFGLPSKATANGLFPRIYSWVENQSFEERHTIELLHSDSFLNEEYVSLFDRTQGIGEDLNQEGVYINSWFNGKKTGLLADFTIGTIDQVLMAALKKKHVMLRLLGIVGKIVIIDECHAYDAYMNYYLDRVLTWLGVYRVPVILLSATLPSIRRRELIDAYLKGRYKLSEIDGNVTSNHYPQITWTNNNKVCQKSIQLSSNQKAVIIDNVKDSQCADYLRRYLSGVGSSGIIVNTVRKAQELAASLQIELPEYKIILYHSQFISSDRAEKENLVLDAVGKRSTFESRSRLIVVGTQVLEQSLDIDFDLLISQLCPMDLLLQRIGRLHRHNRKRPKKCNRPICAILRPGEEYYDKGSRAVYGDWILLRTQRFLKEKITISNDIPLLVNQVYHIPEKDEISQDEANYLDEYLKKREKQKRKANVYCIKEPVKLNIKHPERSLIAGWLDTDLTDRADADAAVRDTDDSIEVIIMVRKTERIISFLPWSENGKEMYADIIPGKNDSLKMMSQRIRLPSLVNRRWDIVIEELTAINQYELSAWQDSMILKGQLFLLLDDNLTTELANFTISYYQNTGLSVSDQCSISGKDVINE